MTLSFAFLLLTSLCAFEELIAQPNTDLKESVRAANYMYDAAQRDSLTELM